MLHFRIMIVVFRMQFSIFLIEIDPEFDTGLEYYRNFLAQFNERESATRNTSTS
jgi:hypothetical protein